MSRHNEVVKQIKFQQVKDNIYLVEMPDGLLNEYLGEVLNSFTTGEADAFSPLMDVSLGEELIARIIADLFVKRNKEVVMTTTGGVIVTCNVNEINYKISIANNQDKLGGIVYGVLG